MEEGIRESLANVPEPRALTRIEDDDAATLKRMQDVGIEHGAASDMLDLLESCTTGTRYSLKTSACST